MSRRAFERRFAYAAQESLGTPQPRYRESQIREARLFQSNDPVARTSRLPVSSSRNPTEKGARVRSFKSLSPQELLALAISLEEEDARIYADFADAVKENYPATAKVLTQMRAEEDGHRHRLIELYRSKFGEHIPLIRRQDVKGFVTRRPIWLVRPLGLQAIRKQVQMMELETKQFYEQAIRQSTDAGIRQLLGDLAEEERDHAQMADIAGNGAARRGQREEEADARKKLFLLQIVQPGLAGLMDGSVSTLAPLFAAAFATHNRWTSNVSGRTRRGGRGRHQHGICRSVVRRRQPDRPRQAAVPRICLRPDDRTRRLGPRAALSDSPFLDRHGRGHRSSCSSSWRQSPGSAIITWTRRWTSALFQVMLGGTIVFITGIAIGSS